MNQCTSDARVLIWAILSVTAYSTAVRIITRTALPAARQGPAARDAVREGAQVRHGRSERQQGRVRVRAAAPGGFHSSGGLSICAVTGAMHTDGSVCRAATFI